MASKGADFRQAIISDLWENRCKYFHINSAAGGTRTHSLLMLSHTEAMRSESSQLLKLTSVSERVSQGFAEIGGRVGGLWDHELFTTEEKIVGENGAVVTRTRGITVGKIVLGVIGLGAGYFVAKTLARLVRARLGRRFSVEIARAAFLEKVIFSFLLVLVVLATLNWLRIPLTAFAFLGGAIAIGVGFGAQTLINNFISGLILLAEQRIKVGDLVDVDGHLAASSASEPVARVSANLMASTFLSPTATSLKRMSSIGLYPTPIIATISSLVLLMALP